MNRVNGKEILTPFRKSSYSGGAQNDCVEVAGMRDGGRAVRDSKRPGGGTLLFDQVAWAAAIDAVERGELGSPKS
ncbi:DUF397 domain-containing protein [Streptomyces niveiscabiei]|uniref:DUF397 domain-containing protein n=1 Tax=Streptomyces niveiscabiei TaxID=164115 RepID=UPI0038F71A6F